MEHPVYINVATSSTFMQASGIVREEGLGDNGEARWVGDLQRRCDLRVGRCFESVCPFCPLISDD